MGRATESADGRWVAIVFVVVVVVVVVVGGGEAWWAVLAGRGDREAVAELVAVVVVGARAGWSTAGIGGAT